MSCLQVLSSASSPFFFLWRRWRRPSCWSEVLSNPRGHCVLAEGTHQGKLVGVPRHTCVPLLHIQPCVFSRASECLSVCAMHASIRALVTSIMTSRMLIRTEKRMSQQMARGQVCQCQRHPPSTETSVLVETGASVRSESIATE